MISPRTQKELAEFARKEFVRFQLSVDRLEVVVEKNVLWLLRLEISDRTFSVGAVIRDGFECLETTKGKAVNFLSHVDEPVFDSQDRLIAEGLSIVKRAIDDPSFVGFERPII